LGVVGTTALGAITTRLINWLLERSAALVVSVTINEAMSSPKLFDQLMELVRRTRDPSQSVTWESLDKFHSYFRGRHYIRICAKNNSKKKLGNL
jgi:hypothetical protein